MKRRPEACVGTDLKQRLKICGVKQLGVLHFILLSGPLIDCGFSQHEAQLTLRLLLEKRRNHLLRELGGSQNDRDASRLRGRTKQSVQEQLAYFVGIVSANIMAALHAMLKDP